ncbi:MarR family transcriptional regulator for hemolysin [Neorhizobium galegae]|uniref:MarR family winged helix-turn-helix transcriptional regulator n=1 Tax=Neorhizobium galegae TaxID=399 RepID=UPI001AE16F13|nr:MarR family transcriptional regulator [Neorhizobium galegae]MBP2550349.1 MarR family transcriptional regulator for hemolysin [Neorhizobium galegae]
METNSDNLRFRFGAELVVIARRWRQFIDQHLAASGLTDASWTPLIYMAHNGDGLLQKDLAALSGLDVSSIVRLVDILAARGLVERRADETDRRARRLYLTELGRQKTREIQQQLHHIEAAMLQDVSDAEIRSALSLIARIEARLSDLKRPSEDDA